MLRLPDLGSVQGMWGGQVGKHGWGGGGVIKSQFPIRIELTLNEHPWDGTIHIMQPGDTITDRLAEC